MTDITHILQTFQEQYMVSFFILIGTLIVLLAANAILGKRIKKLEALKKKDEKSVRTLALPALRFTKRIAIPLLFLVSLSVFLNSVSFADEIHRIVQIVFAVIMTIIIVRSVNKAIELSFSKYFEKEYANHDHAKNLKPLLAFVKLLLWVVGFLILISNLGFNITTALAGLGVGGIAVAIAAQGILGDLFSYFVIFFDHPFALGDFIVFEDKSGVVERIGIKSSRIRVLSGEILIISNSDLTSSRIHNYKQMQRRRVVSTITIPYETPIEKVEKVVGIIKEAIANVQTIEGVICDRSHLQTFGASALVFETVYFVPSPDYLIYMDVQQEINLALLKKFSAEGIDFAYPTQKVFTVPV
jgi:Small-conductance mechanosensitive channel